ncbi:hypothetical protein MMC24_006371 [Lignoscripta atroalba]|nr:hypothetical protein [Lignoscripta atroalba]
MADQKKLLQMSTMNRSTPDSWRSKPIAQEIIYRDSAELEQVCQELRSMPGLVKPEQIDIAQRRLAEAASGNAFVIQGGDCAENFDDVRCEIITAKRAVLARQCQVLGASLGKPIVEIGRIAGQYAKPRSSSSETLSCGTVVVPYRGDNINSLNSNDRFPDPQRLLIGHHLAAVSLGFLKISDTKAIRSSVPALTSEDIASSGFHTSHEALNLPFESALTQDHYNTSAEFLWIGERTRKIDGAHVEYIRGLRNPIGVKLGPTTDPAELLKLLDTLCPNKEVGKVTLITRLGSLKVETALPKLVQAVKASGHTPLWMCDPCHGNTIVTSTGIKTRLVETIIAEIKKTFMVHQRHGTYLGGLHLEQTGEDVTECVDREHAVDKDLQFPSYRSLCDPRLSARQAIHVVQEFAGFVEDFNAISKQTGSTKRRGSALTSLNMDQPIRAAPHMIAQSVVV